METIHSRARLWNYRSSNGLTEVALKVVIWWLQKVLLVGEGSLIKVTEITKIGKWTSNKKWHSKKQQQQQVNKDMPIIFICELYLY